MNRIKHLMILALALTMSIGAWAQGAAPLTTINASSNTAFTSGSQTFDGVATIAFSGTVYNGGDSDGWNIYDPELTPVTLTVTAADGYTIDSVRFTTYDGTLTDTEAPFMAALYGESYYYYPKTTITDLAGGIWGGVQTIEVYGHQGGAAGAVTRTSDNNWTFAMPAYNAALNVTYKDSPALAWTLGGSAMPNDTTITAYLGFTDNLLASLQTTASDNFRAALEAPNTTLFVRHATTDPNVVMVFASGDIHVIGPGQCDIYAVFEGNDDYTYDSAYFHLTILAPATLTLQSNNSEWGSLALGAGAPEETLLTTINSTEPNDSFKSGSRTFDNIATITFSGSVNNYNDLWGWNYGNADEVTLTVTAASEDYTITRVKFYNERLTVHSAFDEEAPFQATLLGGHAYVNGTDLDQFGVTKIEVYGYQGAAPDLPAGVLATEQENVYNILPGTTVKVIATPDSAHYFVNWDEETALNSNTAVEKTLTMGTTQVDLTANFAAKPVLTLAVNDTTWGKVMLEGAASGNSSSETIAQFLASEVNNDVWHEITGTVSNITNTTYGNFDLTDNTASVYVYGLLTPEMQYQQFESMGIVEGTNITIMAHRGKYISNPMARDAYLVSINPAPLPAGVTQLTDSTYRVDYGTEVTVIATANAGYHMDSWSNDDEVTNLLSDTAETITMTEDVTLTATFAQNPTLTIASNNSEWGSLDIEGVGSGKDKFVTDANQLVYTGRHVKVTATDLYDVGVIRLKDEGQQATIETLNGEIIDSIVVTASMNTHNCSYVLSTSGTVQGGNPTTKIRNINAASVVLTAQYGVGISNITVYYTSPDNIDVVAIDYESGIYSVLPGTEVTVNATANEGYYVTGWKDENNSDMATATYSEGLYPVTSSLSFTVTGDTTSMAIFEQSFISPELAWSAETFTAYTMIDFNNWKPTLTNPQNLDVRYGCVEGSVITEGGIPVDEITGIIGAELGIGTVSTKAGTYHIYAVHDFDGNYDYDSVVYTLVVENSATVLVQKNIEEGGAVDFVEPENDLTHNYTNSATLKSVFLAPGADFSVTNTAAEGYHFAKWQTGDNVNGYTDYSTEPNLTYTAPAEFTGNFVVGLKAVFDTNIYNVAYNVQNDTRPQVGTNAPMGSVVLEGQHKHFLNDVLTVTAADGYIFAGWANASGTVVSTENPFVFSPVSDTTLTATFIVGDYTLNATPNIPTSGIVTGIGSYAYRSTVTLEATPSAGYHFVNWVDGSGNVLGTNNELSVQILSDVSVIAVFDTNVYNVAYNVQNDTRPQIGTNAPMGSVVLEGQHKHFLNDVLTATAADGYIFAGWANASGTVVSTENPFAFSPVSDTTLTATFTASNYTLSATPNIPTSGQVTGNGSYAYRSTVTLEATPSIGYHFVNWVDGSGNVLGISTELSVQLLSDVSVIAVFDTNIYNVMANVNIAGLGTVTGAGQVKHFLSTNLVATANLGYHFVHWIDNAGNELGTANTITVFPVSDTVLTAVFEANIYSTVWSGSSTTTYNSQPYTGLVAKYIDFQGNEHTPMLTFTNGSTTITTPNYPVNAGTWTVTATGEVGDVLTNTVNTLVINPAVVYVSNAVVETAKFVDGNTDAVVTNIGTLNNVQGNDVVTHNTTAVFNDATVGEGKTITLTYSLNGDSELLANYNLDPATQVYTTNAYIIEPMTPDTNRVSTEDTTVVEEGMDIYAYGYCSGSTYSIRYHLNSGNPDQYKIDFADNRFTDVDWTDLAIAGTDGTIDIEVPVDLPTGDYTLTVTFRDSRFTWLESKPISVSFHVNLPETYTVVLFDNVIALVDTCHCFTDIQWYHRADASSDWYAIPGATGYYYHATDAQLKGEFFVKVRMNGIETYTCPQTDMETLYSDNEQSVSVKAYPNPATERVTIAISGSTEPIHKLRIINNLGVEMESITFEGDSTVINMSNYQQGNYMVTVDGAVVIVIRN